MRRFAIYDTRGVEAWEQQMEDMGVPAGAIAPPDADWLDTREARNAADAVQAARAEWPEIPVQYLDAREITAAERPRRARGRRAMTESADMLDRWARGLSGALRQAGICPVATLDDGTGVIVRCAYPLNTDWTLWDNGHEMGVQRVNDHDSAVFFPFTGLKGQRLDAMTLLSRIWSAVHGEPIDYAFNYAERMASIAPARTGEAGRA